MVPVTLTIAGSDPSGGAGIQADLKTFHQHGTYGMSVITLLTVQNTVGVEAVRVLEPDFVMQQIQAVISDIPPQAGKTGALGSAEVIDAVCMKAENFHFPLVVDPVMISKHGKPLLDGDGKEFLRKRLLPYAFLVTPNIPEAQELSERSINNLASMEKAAISISKLGVKNVLIKGGHLEDESSDLLLADGLVYRFPAKKLLTNHTHGTGCVLSAAITSMLAKKVRLTDAVSRAKDFVSRAIEHYPGLGRGQGPINLHVPPAKE